MPIHENPEQHCEKHTEDDVVAAEPPGGGTRRRSVVDPLTGAEVVVNSDRQGRPNLPGSGCPFCPGGLEAPDPYDVRWFANRWPALGDDRCEVVLYTPDHEAALWSLGVSGVRRVIDLWAERTSELGSRDDVAYVLVFENRGAEVGATIGHPHGQIYAFDAVPPAVRDELEHGRHDVPDDGSPLLVSVTRSWRSWVPAAAVYPYELRIAPTSHVGALDDPSLDRDALASVMVDSFVRLDQFFDEATPYMMWIHQRPTDGAAWPQQALHLHVAPIRRARGVTRYVAAAELGAHVYFNPVDPERAAADLRAQAGAGADLLDQR